MSEIEFAIIKQIGVLAEYATDWKKELNIVSWNGGTPKMDIRDWNGTHEHMSRGITLHEYEAFELMLLLTAFFDSNPITPPTPDCDE